MHGDRYLMVPWRFDVAAATPYRPRGGEINANSAAQKTILKTRKLHWTGAQGAARLRLSPAQRS
jgi:hypothetical protein